MSKETAAQCLKDHMVTYYRAYYKDSLGLPDWESRIDQFRLREEEVTGERLEIYAKKTGVNLYAGPILVVGCGTGAEVFYLSKTSNYDVYGVDPSREAIDICELKCALKNISAANISVGFAEKLNFPDNFFSMVLCFTVLEHVSDVNSSLNEMYRVLRPGGKAMIVCPDYRYPEEPHYKVTVPPPFFFPHLAKKIIKAKSRPTDFFDSLNFLSRGFLKKILSRMNIPHYFVREMSYKVTNKFILKLYLRCLKIDRNIFLVITK